jgi:hypothetical protein
MSRGARRSRHAQREPMRLLPHLVRLRVMARCLAGLARGVLEWSACQPGRRGWRRGQGRRWASTRRPARLRRRASSPARSRSSLRPTSRNTRSRAPPSPADTRAMVSTWPVNPPTKSAQIAPATTSTAADPNARMRERAATAPTLAPTSRRYYTATEVNERARSASSLATRSGRLQFGRWPVGSSTSCVARSRKCGATASGIGSSLPRT